MQIPCSSKLEASLELKYLVTVPSDYKKEEKLPMIVFLHGAGERGEDLDLVKLYGVPKLFASGDCSLFPDVRAITLSPQCPEGTVWTDNVPFIMKLIDKVAAEYNVDLDRISMTGLSMGGFGTFATAVAYADRFSAIAVVCGGGAQWTASNLTKMKVRFYHGVIDSCVPVTNSVELSRCLKLYGGDPELILFEDLDHNCWDRTYEETDCIRWLVAQKRA